MKDIVRLVWFYVLGSVNLLTDHLHWPKLTVLDSTITVKKHCALVVEHMTSDDFQQSSVTC